MLNFLPGMAVLGSKVDAAARSRLGALVDALRDAYETTPAKDVSEPFDQGRAVRLAANNAFSGLRGATRAERLWAVRKARAEFASEHAFYVTREIAFGRPISFSLVLEKRSEDASFRERCADAMLVTNDADVQKVNNAMFLTRW